MSKSKEQHPHSERRDDDLDHAIEDTFPPAIR